MRTDNPEGLFWETHHFGPEIRQTGGQSWLALIKRLVVRVGIAGQFVDRQSQSQLEPIGGEGAVLVEEDTYGRWPINGPTVSLSLGIGDPNPQSISSPVSMVHGTWAQPVPLYASPCWALEMGGELRG